MLENVDEFVLCRPYVRVLHLVVCRVALGVCNVLEGILPPMS